MKAIVTAWWDERQPREKRLLTIALALIALAFFYNILIAPAMTGTQAIRAALPAMRQQLAEMAGEADEARRLAGAAQNVAPTGDSLAAAVTSSLSDHGISGGRVEPAGTGVQVDLTNVAFSQWIAWLNDMRQQLKIQVAQAHVTPANGGTNDMAEPGSTRGMRGAPGVAGPDDGRYNRFGSGGPGGAGGPADGGGVGRLGRVDVRVTLDAATNSRAAR